MKAFSLCALAAFCSTLALAQDSLLPDLTFETLEGDPVASAELRGPDGGPAVIAFWATWCAPCKKELDAYGEHYRRWRDEYGAEVYAVSVDKARAFAKVGPMAEAKGWEFPVLWDEASAALAALDFQSIPQVLIVDADGRIVYTHSEYGEGDEAEVEEVLAGLKEG